MARSASPEKVGQRLAAARLRRGLTQSSVAERAGLAPSYLSRIENGKVHPTYRTLTQVLRALGADLQEIEGPQVAAKRQGPCPITEKGQCLLDLVHAGAGPERYTPREIRLLRRLGLWLKSVEPSRVRAMEVLLDDLMRAAESSPG